MELENIIRQPSIDLDDITLLTATSPADLIDLEESLSLKVGLNSVPWAFRGQPRTFGTLVPSFQREFKIKQSTGTAQIIEQDLINAFRKHYTALPRNIDMPDPVAIVAGYDLRCLSLMQHYGVPTRLLDWTSDFWSAIYFACSGDPDQDAELWFYDRRIFDNQLVNQPELASLTMRMDASLGPPPYEPNLLTRRNETMIVELDPQLSPRMRQQRAHHTVSSDVFADHAKLIFELKQANVTLDLHEAGSFRRVVVTSGCKKKALTFLEEHKSITASTIFPDVEGLGRFLRWHLDSLLTTLL